MAHFSGGHQRPCLDLQSLYDLASIPLILSSVTLPCQTDSAPVTMISLHFSDIPALSQVRPFTLTVPSIWMVLSKMPFLFMDSHEQASQRDLQGTLYLKHHLSYSLLQKVHLLVFTALNTTQHLLYI